MLKGHILQVAQVCLETQFLKSWVGCFFLFVYFFFGHPEVVTWAVAVATMDPELTVLARNWICIPLLPRHHDPVAPQQQLLFFFFFFFPFSFPSPWVWLTKLKGKKKKWPENNITKYTHGLCFPLSPVKSKTATCNLKQFLLLANGLLSLKQRKGCSLPWWWAPGHSPGALLPGLFASLVFLGNHCQFWRNYWKFWKNHRRKLRNGSFAFLPESWHLPSIAPIKRPFRWTGDLGLIHANYCLWNG